tara:strand:+ start:70 stop:1305 length:1236 start_codon:yes stop_codon:yes gene_type:complete
MKILIVNATDIDGGAARASYRLHRALLENGLDSEMLVQDKKSDDYTVRGPITKIQKGFAKIRPTLDSIPVYFFKNHKQELFSPSWFGLSGIVKKINKIKPDIVHLNWICGGMMTIEEIAKIDAPIVWSLHDMWAFTSGSHYCIKYKSYHKNTTSKKTQRESILSRRIFKRKQKAYARKKDITIVGLSKWINECSKSSELLHSKNHVNIPNLINTNIFKPFNKNQARELWALPKNKKLILFGAMSATSDLRKGFKQLIDAIRNLKSSEIEFIVFGSSKPKNKLDIGYRIHYLGNLHDDVSLITLLSAADVVVVPSLQENLSNVIMESLACGTPVAAFDIGGNSDMINHKENGYLAKPLDSNDLASGIDWIINSSEYYSLCKNARKKVLNEFSSDHVVKTYKELYTKILESSN